MNRIAAIKKIKNSNWYYEVGYSQNIDYFSDEGLKQTLKSVKGYNIFYKKISSRKGDLRHCKLCGVDRNREDVLWFSSDEFGNIGNICRICAKSLGYVLKLDNLSGLRTWVKK